VYQSFIGSNFIRYVFQKEGRKERGGKMREKRPKPALPSHAIPAYIFVLKADICDAGKGGEKREGGKLR